MAVLGVPCKGVEGKNSGWSLLDYGDVIISVFTQDERQKYNLEALWDQQGTESERSKTSVGEWIQQTEN